jgi:hypothetical protein
MTTQRVELSIAQAFTTTPGPRKRRDGQFSGEQFLDEQLRPRFVEAQDSNSVLRVNLDGVAGYPTSFLEEAFGGLAREFGPDRIESRLEFICQDEPYLEQEIRRYIKEANAK